MIIVVKDATYAVANWKYKLSFRNYLSRVLHCYVLFV